MTRKIYSISNKYWLPFVFITSTLLLSLLLGASSPESISHNNKTEADDPEMIIQDFLKNIQKKGGIRAEVYYFNWTALTRFAITEERIIDASNYKIVCHSVDKRELEKLFKNIQLTKLSDVEPSAFCRLSIIFYLQEKQVLRLTFNSNDAVVLVNGKPYLVPFKIIDEMLSYLPYREYKRVIKRIEEDWYNLYITYPMLLKTIEQKSDNN
ncbi:MAG: hypothetical protein ACYTEU_10865 [Planctomycetota bacterium]|jgi:hypothetical protein